MKPVPLTVSVNPALPATIEFGKIAVIAGAELTMFNCAAFDAPPPAPAVFGGVKTVTLADSTLAMSEAGIIAVNCVAEMKVVGRFAPFQRT
ncbi:MAG TPA: hypothetical protein VKG02_26170, partial [Blastocatellia bacterium]|nr:hypothetical protein [Blastocatellia bacterium]